MIARLESFTNRFLPKGSAMRHISVIACSTAIAQFIGVVTMPILSRIYLPEDFGVMAAFLSVTAILNEATGLRYPFAIPLPKHDRYADALVVLSFLIQFVLVMLVAFLLLAIGKPLLSLLSLEALMPYRLLIPVGVAGMGIYFTLSQWAIREKSFSTIARTKLTQSVSGVIAKIILGVLGFHPLGLLLGSIVSQAGGATTLLRSLLKKREWPKTSRKDLIKVALRYRRFPIFSTWSGIMITLGGRIAPILLVAFFDTHVAGLFAMAQALLYVPSIFISQAIHPVFLQRASTAKHDGNLQHVFRKASKILMRVGFFPILLIAFFAPWLLHIFLGAKWQEAGIFSQIIAPWVAINFVFSPLSSVFSVLERQRAGLIFEIVHLPLRIISLFLGAKTGNVIIAVMFLTIVNAGIYFLKLGYLYLVTENSIASFLQDFAKETSFAILLCIFPVLCLQMSLGTVVIILVVLLSVVYYSKQLLSMLDQTYINPLKGVDKVVMDFLKIMRLPKVLFRISIFLARNLWQARKIPVIYKGTYDDVEFLPCTKDLVPYVSKLYAQFHEGLKLGLDKKILYSLAGEKLCLVIRDKKTNQIVGYSLCYFNRRDIKEATIHEGDISLHSDYRGKGIGTAQRVHVLRHFARCTFIKGLSSRIDLDNQASLKSGEKVGYKVQECYFDQSRGKERAYLICDLTPYRQCASKEEQESTFPKRKDDLS